MSRVPLSDEESRVIFAGEAASNFGALEGSEQKQVINRLVTILESDTKPSSLIYERIGNLDIFTVGSQIRLYTKVVDEIPRGNAEYHVVYLFYIDDDHDYDNKTLATYSPEAKTKVKRITAIQTVPDVEQYLDENDALDAAALRDLLQ